ncbi:MAG: DUF1269 domain-containing protein [Bacteroidaceae bacterium]|nr:DUF1269 domain-containing protein [Bacteroidaceae bacterium]
MDNVMTVIFRVESEAYQAFTEIQAEQKGENYFVPQMALVKYEVGSLKTLNEYQSPYVEDGKAFAGGLFGSWLGLLGGAYGASVGLLAGSIESETGASLLEKVCQKLEEGSVAIVALIREVSEEPLDHILNKFDATIMRRDAVFVAEEVAEARLAEADLREQLQAKLRKEKKQEITEAVQKKRSKLAADFDAFKKKFLKF